VLAAIWAEVLGVERVGAHENFFELGGHSLMASEVMFRVRKLYQVAFPLRKLFDAPTLSGLAQAIDAEKFSAPGNEIPRLRPRGSGARVPLSYAQEGAWFIDQLERGVAFNIPLALRVQGPLSLEALEWALNAVVRRHEVLRTTFAEIEGQPVQVVAPSLSVSIAEVPIQGGDDELLRKVIETARQPFDLARGPLLRMVALRLDAEDTVLVLTVHHGVFDGWSVSILLSELGVFYGSRLADSEPTLPELPVQYGDYAIWQRETLATGFLEPQIGYWMQQLSQHPVALSLPTDRPESTARLFRGNVVSLPLSETLSLSLRALGRREGSTLFMVLLGAFQALLARYSGQDDIVVGTPIANRNQPEQERLIGFCVNLLALRTDLSGNPSFLQLVERVREVCLAAYRHQDLPFGLVVQKLHPDRHLSHSPIFQVQFSLQTARTDEVRLPGLRLSWLSSAASVSDELRNLLVEATPATDPLFLYATDTGTDIHLLMHYRSDLFEAATIDRMMRHLVLLLEGGVADAGRPVFEIALAGRDEIEQLTALASGMALPIASGIGIHHLFEARSEQMPDAVAVVLADPAAEDRITFRRLNERANQIAGHLQSRGAGPGVRVGICLERSLERIAAVLGVLKAGAAYVPLDPSYPDERLRYMAADADIRLQLTKESLAESFSEPIALDRPVPIGDLDLAYVIYTSGSTGRPKGVMAPHRSLINAYCAWEQAYQLRAGQYHLQMASFSFDVFAGDFVRALSSGGTLVLCPPESLLVPEDLHRLLAEYRVACAEFVPATVRLLIEHLEQSGQSLEWMERIIVGSDSWSCREYERLRQLAGRQARVVNSYGVAEATIDSSYLESLPEGSSAGERVPIGHPFANTETWILDPGLQPVPVGVTGELHIGGLGLARGYLARPDRTAERFLPHPFSRRSGERLYRTGDRARWSRDGEIEFLGRGDEQVKIRGFRVETREIEALLAEHPGVREAVVVARDSPTGEKRLVAYAVLHGEPDATPGELRAFLEARLPPYMMPAALLLLDRLPLTPNGKVDRRALPAPDVGRPEWTGAYVEPRTQTEIEIARIWAEELHLDRVGARDNFFAIGGHSLLAAKVMARLRGRLQLDLSLRELFRNPTVAALAQATDLTLATGRAAADPGLDLEREVELDASIVASDEPFAAPARMERVLLTGATGFLGAFLLREALCETNADVYCLVRADSLEEASKKLRRALEKYGLWEGAVGRRVIPVLGDLGEPRLGLSPEQYEELGASLDLIYHNGAQVNAVYPYALLKAANVSGTAEVLRLACHLRVKPVHYVSTISVFSPESLASGVMDERFVVDGGSSLAGGYAQSKWVAERLLNLAAERGVPVSIYRPGRISGDSRTGLWIPDRWLTDSLQTLLELGSLPRLPEDLPIELVPVDYVAQAIVRLSRQPESLGKAFHLVNPHPVAWRDLVDRLSAVGSPLPEMEPRRWAHELLQFARSHPTSFLHPLVDLVPPDLLARWEDSEAAAPAPGSWIRIDCTNTLEGLKDHPVSCPPVVELLDRYLTYFVESGLLIPPPNARDMRVGIQVGAPGPSAGRPSARARSERAMRKEASPREEARGMGPQRTDEGQRHDA
jgi:amino acid adenylation domain-containing protein/thioester reductase-like protein